MSVEHYTFNVIWSDEDGEYVGLCNELPSLSWLAASFEEALSGIRGIAMNIFLDIHED